MCKGAKGGAVPPLANLTGKVSNYMSTTHERGAQLMQCSVELVELVELVDSCDWCSWSSPS